MKDAVLSTSMKMLEISQEMRNGSKIKLSTQIALVLSLSTPAILEQLAHTAMSYIDTAMVGSLGHEATASIGVVASSTWLIGGITSAVAIGFSVQVAQMIGAGKNKDARSVLCQAIKFNVYFGILLAFIAYLIGFGLPKMLGAEEALRANATAYFQIYALFLPFSLASALYSSILRCSGNILLPSLMNIGMCVLDVIFNLIFIYPTREVWGITLYGAGMGVKGASLGTGLAMATTAIILFLFTIKGKGVLKLTKDDDWHFRKSTMKNLAYIATPSALERITISLAQIVLTGVVASMGAVAIASNYVAVQTEGICYLPAYGISSAATAMVGQSLGAGRKDMAKRFAYLSVLMSFLLVVVTASLLFYFAPFLTGLLTHDQEVIELGSRVLKIVSFSEPLFAVSIVAIGALRGAGDSKVPFYMNLVSMWGVRVLTVLLFTRQFGVVGVWISMTIELCFRGIIFLYRLIRGNWLNTVLAQ